MNLNSGSMNGKVYRTPVEREKVYKKNEIRGETVERGGGNVLERRFSSDKPYIIRFEE